jgi:hypothetical protein
MTEENAGAVHHGVWFEAAVNSLRERDARLRRLWQMAAAERRTAMFSGQLTYSECCAWAARYRDEVPTLNGEFWFIAITTPEIAGD